MRPIKRPGRAVWTTAFAQWAQGEFIDAGALGALAGLSQALFAIAVHKGDLEVRRGEIYGFLGLILGADLRGNRRAALSRVGSVVESAATFALGLALTLRHEALADNVQ